MKYYVIYKYTDTVLQKNTYRSDKKKNVVIDKNIKDCDQLFKIYSSILNNNQYNELGVKDAYQAYQQTRDK